MFSNPDSLVIVHSPLNQSAFVPLNLKDNLSEIRIKLEKDSVVKMNDKLSFAKKTSQPTEILAEFAEMPHENEVDVRLADIIEIVKKDNVLHLKGTSKSVKTTWEFFNDKCKLDYGRTMTNDGIKIAENRAFIMKDCEPNDISSQGCQTRKVEFNSNKLEDWIMKANLFFTTDDKVQNFVNLGLSFGTLREEKFKSETNVSYHYTNYGKSSLKFSKGSGSDSESKFLEPTTEFINAVNDAIKSGNTKDFIRITDKFGQFITTEVILGGKVYFEDYGSLTECSTKDGNEAAMSLAVPSIIKSKISISSGRTKENSKNYKFNYKGLIGGKQPENFGNFNEAAETAWAKSLNDYRNWDCIEFQNPISIFQLLSKESRKKIFLSLGKRILHLQTDHIKYYLGNSKVYKLNIPSNISKILLNEEADCNIFATVFDTEDSKNDFFTCQILCPPKGIPSLIIHCFQNQKNQAFRKRKYRLQIRWMVIGYDIDFNFFLPDFQLEVLKNEFNSSNNQTMVKKFPGILSIPPCIGIPVLEKSDSSNNTLIIGHHFFNNQHETNIEAFSYCLKKNNCVDLPNFTFYTFIISNHHIHSSCDIISLPYNIINTGNPKFISLYSTQSTNCKLIFLKQKSRQIKPKFINCNEENCSICRNQALISTNNIKCALFDPHSTY